LPAIPEPPPAPIWSPTPEAVERAAITAFGRLAHERGAPASVLGHAGLYDWSVAEPARFWSLLWERCGVVADVRADGARWDAVLVGGDRMAPPDPVLGPRWFTGARLNFAENLLRRRDGHPAVVSWDERGRQRALSYAELHAAVHTCAAALRGAGVSVGDRVAGFLPNIPEAVIAMLAAASLGAVWSSCSPDFGVAGVLDRFGQIAPRVLVAADGYRYAGKEIDCLDRLASIVREIPAIERTVVVPWLRADPDLTGIPGAVRWDEFTAAPAHDAPAFARLPFDHPLYVMYSSGTTGLPKCMVHGAGGTLLQHLKELVLHTGLTPESRLFYFTTCGWMMWNWLVSGLGVGATVVLYDGAPLPAARPAVLWDMAAEEGVTVFGTSARYLALAEKAGLAPRDTHDLGALDAVLSTGSPLAPASYRWVRDRVSPTARLSSISGGTDIISCFALGNPAAPVWEGELQTRGLGMAVAVWDADGGPLRGEPGELVCTRPFPSMPVSFWNDPDGAKYRAAYFAHYPNVWRHGDWAELTAHDGLVIHGRSDATLNPGGVRIGTAEIYREVERVPEVVESVVVAQAVGGDRGGDTRVVLFVRLAPGATLDDGLRGRIREQIRRNTSAHHVPKRIVAVPDIPRTISGKISELAVRDVIHGRAVHNADALANPESLAHFRDLPELHD
jgi:acetoacetyl-CoA synthetase